MTEEVAEELFRQVSAFASFGFAKSHAAAFARTAYESSFLKLFYPAQFLVGLINAQPMGFYPVEVLVNDAKRHGVAVLPVDLNASTYKTTTEWAGRPGWALGDGAGEGEPLPEGSGIDERPLPVQSSACVLPGAAARERWAAESATGWGVRLGLHLVKGIGEQHEELLDRELERGPYVSLADVVERTGLPEETIERLIRTGALDSLGRPRRELLWQLREVTGVVRGRGVGSARTSRRVASDRAFGSMGRRRGPGGRRRRPGDRWTSAFPPRRRRACRRSPSRSGWATPTRWSGSTRSARSWRSSATRSIGWAPSRTPRWPTCGRAGFDWAASSSRASTR